MATAIPYDKGLHRVGDSTWAYLQPDGGWGWSNAGLVQPTQAFSSVELIRHSYSSTWISPSMTVAFWTQPT